jgi:hypothetical protein
MDFKYFFRADFLTMALTIAAFALAEVRRRRIARKEEQTKEANQKIQAAFVKSVAVNHLPHIQDALYQIGAKLGIQLEPPPPIEWIELNGKDK